MVKSVLPCLVIVRRQPVPSLFHPSALPAPSLFAKTANSPYFVFNHFRTLLHSCTPRVLLISFLFFRLRTLCEKQGGVGVLFPNWNPTPSPSPRPAPLPSLSPSIRGGRRPRKSPRGGGCCRWMPFSFSRAITTCTNSLLSLRRSSFCFISWMECARRISARTATSYSSSSVS